MNSLNTQIIRILDYLVNQEIDYDLVETSLRNIKDELILVSNNPTIESKNDLIETPKKRKKDSFNYKDTEAYQMIVDKFGNNIRQQELIQIACCLSKKIGVKVERDSKRRKDLLFKWFQDNIDKISPMLHLVVAFGKDGGVLKKEDDYSYHN